MYEVWVKGVCGNVRFLGQPTRGPCNACRFADTYHVPSMHHQTHPHEQTHAPIDTHTCNKKSDLLVYSAYIEAKFAAASYAAGRINPKVLKPVVAYTICDSICFAN